MFNRMKKLIDIKKKSSRKKQKIKMDKECAVIDVGAENYDDIFSPFCLYDMNVLDFELEDYLDNKNEQIPLEYDLKLVFHIKDANEEKRKEVESTVKQNYEARAFNIEKKMKQNRTFSLTMLLVGIVFLLLNVWSNGSNIPFLVTAILEIGSWVFIWTAVDAFFLERKLLQIEKIMINRLITAPVEVYDFIPKWAKVTAQEKNTDLMI